VARVRLKAAEQTIKPIVNRLSAMIAFRGQFPLAGRLMNDYGGLKTMILVKETLCFIDGDRYTADVIAPEPGSNDTVGSLVPGTLKPVNLDSLPLTEEQRRRAKAKLAEMENRIPRS
jgi:hypothetical protein